MHGRIKDFHREALVEENKKLTNLKDISYGIIPFLDITVVQSCLVRVPIKVLQYQLAKSFLSYLLACGGLEGIIN